MISIDYTKSDYIVEDPLNEYKQNFSETRNTSI